MARKRHTSILDEIASLPWYAGLVLGIIAFILVRSLGGMVAPLAWIFLIACWLAAGVSFLKSSKRKQLLATQTGLASITAIDWREFEMLVGEAFKRKGYFVEETGLGGKDGGIDLVVSKHGRKELVQCKQWRSQLVRASTVREMWGLADHHGAAAVHIVCVGNFTPDAAAFARGKPIELVTGELLLNMVREAQSGDARKAAMDRADSHGPRQVASDPITCPTCASTMVQRHNRRTGQPFWGCPDYPRCRGTRPA